MSEIYAARRKKLREHLQDQEISAFVTHNLINARYLTGFTGSHATVVVGPDSQDDIIFTDGRYAHQVKQQCPDLRTSIESASLKAAADLLTHKNIPSVGIESAHMSLEQYRKFTSWYKGQCVELTSMVENLRQAKDHSETELLAHACHISTQALSEFITQPVLGCSEIELARRLENLMADHGAEGTSFETIMASGANSGNPHHHPSAKKVQQGDFLKIDFGALYGGYHADMTRTFIVGEPQDWQQEIYALVAKAQETACHSIAIGMEYSALDAIARDIIAEGGYGDKYPHSLGHGIGLEIHEAPGVSSRSVGTIKNGDVFTIEPGIYLGGRGGVRIEDSVQVCSEGIKIFTNFPKELISIS